MNIIVRKDIQHPNNGHTVWAKEEENERLFPVGGVEPGRKGGWIIYKWRGVWSRVHLEFKTQNAAVAWLVLLEKAFRAGDIINGDRCQP